jgi:NADH:ubiquinone oxidoreductase subunit 6 (subunit J)
MARWEASPPVVLSTPPIHQEFSDDAEFSYNSSSRNGINNYSTTDEKSALWNNRLDNSTTSEAATEATYKSDDKSLSLMLGFFVLAVLLFRPVCNAMLWAQQSEILFFVGAFRVYVFIMPVLVLPLYVMTITVFFHRSSPEVRTYKTGIMISCLFITLVGVLNIVLSQPLVYRSIQAFDDLWSECGYSDVSRLVYKEYVYLYAVRLQPACLRMESVELCDGFIQSDHAAVLKAMERNLECSGFCHTDYTVDSATYSSQVNKTAPYPPTLFSQANYQAGCDSMLARELKDWVAETASETFLAGFVLLCSAVVLAVGLVMSATNSCSGGTRSSRRKKRGEKKLLNDSLGSPRVPRTLGAYGQVVPPTAGTY